jgi:hypothetical protein
MFSDRFRVGINIPITRPNHMHILKLEKTQIQTQTQSTWIFSIKIEVGQTDTRTYELFCHMPQLYAIYI